MILIFGLGNPGKQYEYTRHNVGFLAIDKIAAACKFEAFKKEKKLKSEISRGSIENVEAILIKPQTFMNKSGEAIIACKNFFKVPLGKIIVIHDDIDIELGKIKFTPKSRSAGHNGIKSIINALGTEEFKRIRIGIDSRKNGLWQKVFGKIPTERFVLEKFNRDELEMLNSNFDNILDEIKTKLLN